MFKHLKISSKLTMNSPRYQAGENTKTENVNARVRFNQTGVSFLINPM